MSGQPKSNVIPLRVPTGGRRGPGRPPTTQPDPREAAAAELVWFFEVHDVGSESDGERISKVHCDDKAAQAYRKIRQWLVEMTDHDAGVLRAAFTPGPWPEGLRKELGHVTGIVVRLASVQAGWPEDRTDQEKLEARVAGQLEKARARDGAVVFAGFRAKAEEHFKTAMQSYMRERGYGESVVKGLV